MATTTQRTNPTTAIDELSFNNDAVSMCLLVNRRNQTTRVIDFRAGATQAKRNFVLATAKREGIEKLFVLVERDEVNTWNRLGFRREGSIPGFYRRSDAWIMGAVVSTVGPMRPERAYDDEDDLDDDGPNPAVEVADKTVDKAKKLAKEQVELPATKVAVAKRDAVQKAVLAATKAGRALTGFESFSRDAERSYLTVSGKGGFELVASYEVQPSFASSMLEILTGPRDDAERVLTISALRSLAGKLVETGSTSTFSIVPADDVALASCFVASGFRKSAALASHLVVGGKRRDAILFSKKLGDN